VDGKSKFINFPNFCESIAFIFVQGFEGKIRTSVGSVSSDIDSFGDSAQRLLTLLLKNKIFSRYFEFLKSFL
jgi:hypothetical protein